MEEWDKKYFDALKDPTPEDKEWVIREKSKRNGLYGLKGHKSITLAGMTALSSVLTKTQSSGFGIRSLKSFISPKSVKARKKRKIEKAMKKKYNNRNSK